MTQPYDELFSFLDEDSSGLEDWLVKKQESYEDKIVSTFITKLKLYSSVSLARYEAKDRTGSPTLTFAWFHDRFPTCPVRLCAKSLPYIHQLKVADLFKSSKLPFLQSFGEARATFPEDAQLNSWGLVFNWPGISQMIVHNSGLLPGKTRFIKEIGDKQVVYLDILADFISSLSSVWSP